MGKKIVVVDTSVLVSDPEVLLKLCGCRIVVPVAAVGELDRLKGGGPGDPRARAARKAARILDTLGGGQDISAGAKTPSGATVTIYRSHAEVRGLPGMADNKIIGTALKLARAKRSEVVLLSNDRNIRNVSRAYGIKAAAYPFKTDSFPSGPDGRLGDSPARATSDVAAVRPKEDTVGSWLYLWVPVALIIFIVLLAAASR